MRNAVRTLFVGAVLVSVTHCIGLPLTDGWESEAGIVVAFILTLPAVASVGPVSYAVIRLLFRIVRS